MSRSTPLIFLNILLKYDAKNTVIYGCCCLFSSLLLSVQLWAVNSLVNALEKIVYNEFSATSFVFSAVFLSAVLLLIECATWLKSISLLKIELSLKNAFAPGILEKLNKIEYHYFENETTYNIINRMSSEPYNEYKKSFVYFVELIGNFFSLIGILAFFSKVSFFFTAFNLIIIGLIIFFDYKIMSTMYNLLNEQSKHERKFNYFNGLFRNKNANLEIKIFATASFFYKKIKDIMKTIFSQRFRTTIKGQKFLALSSLCYIFWVAAILVYIGMKSAGGLITAGFIAATLSAIEMVYNLSGNISENFTYYIESLLSTGNYIRFTNLKDENRTMLPSNNEISFEQMPKFHIAFDNVSFMYPGTEKYVLSDLSFEIKFPETIALVGDNGAGKSTIIKLLCGLYRPLEGRITINGSDLNNFNYADLNKIFSVVFQNYVKYQTSVREVLAAGKKGFLDDNKIQESLSAMKLSELAVDIDRPLGKLKENSDNLSEGQWQKLRICGAYLANTPFVILDEPTSSLDPRAENALYELFLQTMENRSAIIVSHRLASARLADKIFVIRNGRIIESGPHGYLMRKDSAYAEMYKTQLSWYQNTGKARI